MLCISSTPEMVQTRLWRQVGLSHSINKFLSYIFVCSVIIHLVWAIFILLKSLLMTKLFELNSKPRLSTSAQSKLSNKYYLWHTMWCWIQRLSFHGANIKPRWIGRYADYLYQTVLSNSDSQMLDSSYKSTVYWCIASKSKSRYFFHEINITFLWVDLSLFNQSYSDGITTTKRLPDIGGTTIQDVGLQLPLEEPWSLASTPWAMSLYFKLRAIYFWPLNEYYWWDQAKIYHITW